MYQATVTSIEQNTESEMINKETYIGLTCTEFKARFASHKQSFSKGKGICLTSKSLCNINPTLPFPMAKPKTE